MDNSFYIDGSIVEYKSIATANGTEEHYLKGYASTEDIDRHREIVPMDVIQKSMKNNLPFMYEHGARKGFEDPIGTVKNYGFDAKGMWIEASFADTEQAKYVHKLIKSKSVNHLSLRFLGKKDPSSWQSTPTVYKSVDILEVSAVAIPANPNAEITEVKHFDNNSSLQQPEIFTDDVQKDYCEQFMKAFNQYIKEML